MYGNVIMAQPLQRFTQLSDKFSMSTDWLLIFGASQSA